MPVARAPSRTLAPTVAVLAVAGVGAYSLQRYFFRTALAESSQEPPVHFGGGMNLTSLRLYSVQIVNHNTKRLLFELPDKDARCGLSLTSALLTITRPKGRWLPVIRPYTPINDFREPGFIELMVKKYPNGKASSHLHSLEPGQSVTFAGPVKGFPWSPNKFSHVYLLAGGAGITPIYQLIQGILNNPEDKTKMTLVFGVNTEEDLVLRDELDGFKKRFPDRFNVVYTVSDPSKTADGSSSPFNPSYKQGRITESLLKEVMKGPDEKNIKIFVCGPPAMEASLTGYRNQGILGKLGYRKDHIHKF